MDKEIEYIRARCSELSIAIQHNFLHDDLGNKRVAFEVSPHDLASTVHALHYFLPPELIPQILYISSVCSRLDEMTKLNTVRDCQYLRFDFAVCAFHFNTHPVSRLLHPAPLPPSLVFQNGVYHPTGHYGYVQSQMNFQPPHPAMPFAAAPTPYPMSSHPPVQQPQQLCFPQESSLPAAAAVAPKTPQRKPTAQEPEPPVLAAEEPAAAAGGGKDAADTSKARASPTGSSEPKVAAKLKDKEVAKPSIDLPVHSDQVYITEKKSSLKTSPVLRSFGAIAASTPKTPPPPVNTNADAEAVTKEDETGSLTDSTSSTALNSPVPEESTASFNFFSGQTLEHSPQKSSSSSSTTHGNIGKAMDEKDPQATSALKALLNIESSKRNSNTTTTGSTTTKQRRKQRVRKGGKHFSDATTRDVEQRRLDIDPDIFNYFTPEFIQSVEKETETSISWPPADAHFFVVRGSLAMHVAKAKEMILKVETKLRLNFQPQPPEEDNQRDDYHSPSKTTTGNDETNQTAAAAVPVDSFRAQLGQLGLDSRATRATVQLTPKQRTDLMDLYRAKKDAIKNTSGWFYRKSTKMRKENSRGAGKLLKPAVDMPQLEIVSDDEEQQHQRQKVDSNPIFTSWAVQDNNWTYFQK